MSQWYYRLGKQEFGPVNEHQLADLLSQATLRPTDRVRAEGELSWRPINDAVSLSVTGSDSGEWSSADLDSMLSTEEESSSPSSNDLDLLLAGAPPTSATALDRTSSSSVRVAAPQDDSGLWYYKSAGQELGPIPYSVIENLVSNGVLTANDYIRSGERGAWQRVGRISGLLPPNTQEQSRPQLAQRDSDPLMGTDTEPQPSVEAVDQEADEPEDDIEETSARSRKRSGKGNKKQNHKGERRKTKSKLLAQRSEDLAADLLSEFDEPEEEVRPVAPRASQTESRPRPNNDPSTAATQTVATTVTPPPMNRPLAAPAPATFRRPSRSWKLPLPEDPKKGLIALALVGLLAGGYFIPWSSLTASSAGESREKMFERASEIWSAVQTIQAKKDATTKEWDDLKYDYLPIINRHLKQLRPHIKDDDKANDLYKFEREGLQKVLVNDKRATPAMYTKAEELFEQVKKHTSG